MAREECKELEINSSTEKNPELSDNSFHYNCQEEAF